MGYSRSRVARLTSRAKTVKRQTCSVNITPPQFLKKYFWDVDFEKLDIEKYRFYVIRRILNYGDEKAILWMNSHFKRDDQIKALCTTRDISLRSANFWTLILGVPKRKVKCLQKRYLEIRRQFWPY